MKAIIIGAGIGGLTAAIALKNKGIEVEVYEQASEFKRLGAGISLWTNALRAFKEIGLEQKIINLGAEINSSKLLTYNGQELSAIPAAQFKEKFGFPSVVIHRGDLQEILVDALGAESIFLNKTFQAYHDNDGITVDFLDGTSARGDLLIAADGIHSKVRRQCFGDIPPKYAGATVFRGICKQDIPEVELGSCFETWGQNGRFGVFPMRNNEIYWYFTFKQPANNILKEEKRKSFVETNVSNWHQPIASIIRKTDMPDILQNDMFEIPALKTWYKNNLVLLGDAAHAMQPNLGQGAVMAIEDAIILADALAKHDDITTALEDYQSRRLARANKVQRLSKHLGPIGQINNPILSSLRNTIFKLIPNSFRMREFNWLFNFEI